MQEIKRFTIPNEKADAIIRRSFLSDNLKQLYMSGYHYRAVNDSSKNIILN